MKSYEQFIPQQAECEFIFVEGQAWPQYVVANLYAENGLGERKLLESKSFELVERPKNARVEVQDG